MDDESDSPGLIGATGYVLGRMSAQNERALGDFGKALQRRFQPAPPTVDITALIAENEMLRSQLASTRAELSNLEADYSRLRAWGTQASELLNKHGLIKK